MREYTYVLLHIIGAVSQKYPRFCKCLIFLNSGFSILSNSAGCQNLPALSESNIRSMIELSLRVVDIVLVEEKDKSNIHCSAKDGYVIV